MFCICCGQKINDDAQACPYCGMIVSKTLAQRMNGGMPAHPGKPAEENTAGTQHTAKVLDYQEPLYENIRRTGPTKVQENRDFVRFLIFNLFTIGIYGIVMMYRLTEDVNKICADDGKDTMNYLVMIILNLFTFGIYYLVWHFQIGERISKYLSENYQVTIPGGGRLLALKFLTVPTLFITGHLADYFLIDSVNTLAQAYNNEIGCEE